MHDDLQPTTGELLQAIVALHAFTEAGLQRLDAKIDGIDTKFEGKIDGLRFEMNKRFDHVYGELDDIKSRVTRLEPRPT